MLRRFFLERNCDVSGISGTGIVADGCVFDTGEAVVHWLGEHSCINVYKNINDVIYIHGHNGSTKVIFKD